jgi:hypothetical protein
MRRDAEVFAGAGWTLVRAQAALGEGFGKVREGGVFFSRGLRLLWSDLRSAGRLFARAAAGASLKPREVRRQSLPHVHHFVCCWHCSSSKPQLSTLFDEVRYVSDWRMIGALMCPLALQS